jgi:hypothetical protein
MSFNGHLLGEEEIEPQGHGGDKESKECSPQRHKEHREK